MDRLFNHQPSCFLGSQETNQPHLNFGFQKRDPPLTHHTTWVGSVILLVFRQGHGLWIAAAIAVVFLQATFALRSPGLELSGAYVEPPSS